MSAANQRVVQIHSALELTTAERDTIEFAAGAEPRPNPFLVTTDGAIVLRRDGELESGIAAVEIIRVAYAAQLGPYVGEQIIAATRE